MFEAFKAETRGGGMIEVNGELITEENGVSDLHVSKHDGISNHKLSNTVPEDTCARVV